LLKRFFASIRLLMIDEKRSKKQRKQNFNFKLDRFAIPFYILHRSDIILKKTF